MFEVIVPGLETSIQDYPGRIGFWNQGFPPSGPMDSWSFRLANLLVGNEPGAAGLEAQYMGPTLRFQRDGVIAITGADMPSQVRATVAELEKQRILEALEKCAGNQTRAAEMLGISRRTLINRLDEYGIARPRKRDDPQGQG